MRGDILLSAVLSFGLITGAGAEIAFAPTSPDANSFRLGSLSLTALHDSTISVANDGKTFGIGVSPNEVADVLRAAGAPTDRITLSVNALLVRTGPRIVLVDTGLGPKNHGELLSSLRLTGVAPSAVTEILITHPHMDHIGGLLDGKGRLAFPNARIRMTSEAWDWLRQQAPAAFIQIVAARVQTFKAGATVAPGIISVPLPGHTPGHVGYEITSGTSRLIDIGDIAHSSIVSLAKPKWAIEFDSDRTLAEETRVQTLATLARDHTLVFSPHFPFPGIGHIAASGNGFRWKPGLP